MRYSKTIRIAVAALPLSIWSYCWSAEAICEIEIEDVVSATTYSVEHSFESGIGFAAQRKHFDLPGSKIRCTLAFFNLDSGTMISCELDELGHHFVQSDRSVLDEQNPRNYLSFRYQSHFYVLKSSCQ